MKTTFFALILTLSTLAQASLLTYTTGDKNLNGIVLNKTAMVNDASGKATAASMDLLGAGLRSKTVIIDVKVYTLQLFSDNKAGFSRDANALSTLVKNSNRVALKLDMLRTVSASSLSDSLKEALAANGYTADAELNNVLSIFGKSAEATNGKSVSVLLVKDTQNNKTNLYYEDTKGAVQSMVGSPELLTKILSIWLGTPVDSGIQKLKNALMAPVY